MIDLATVSGITLNSSGSATANSTALATLISNIASGSVADHAVTWEGDLYVQSSFPFPFVTVNGTNSVYFSIIGSGRTRLIYLGSGWAIDYTWGLPAQENDQHSILVLQDLVIQAWNGNGLRINRGGKDWRLRNVVVSECGLTSGTGNGIYLTDCSGMQLDSLYALGNTGYGMTLNNCTQMQTSNLIARSNGGDGVVTTGVASAWEGEIYAESNGGYGCNFNGLTRSQLVLWQEANRQTSTGGSVGRNPSSPSSAVYPGGRTGTSIAQGTLTNSFGNVLSGQYGQDCAADFDYDLWSWNMNQFPNDPRKLNISAATGWTQVCTNCNLNSPTVWTGSQYGLVNNDGGTGINSLTIKTGALSGGYPISGGNAGYFELRQQDNSYLGGSGYTWAAGDLFVIEADVSADSGTHTYMAASKQRVAGSQTMKLNPMSGIGLDGNLQQVWFLPTTATSGPTRMRSFQAATAAGSNTALRAFLYPVLGMQNAGAAEPTQDLHFTIKNITVWHYPQTASWSVP